MAASRHTQSVDDGRSAVGSVGNATFKAQRPPVNRLENHSRMPVMVVAFVNEGAGIGTMRRMLEAGVHSDEMSASPT